jgi:hypothetical protein
LPLRWPIRLPAMQERGRRKATGQTLRSKMKTAGQR